MYVHVLVVAGCPSTKGYRAAEDGARVRCQHEQRKKTEKERKKKSRTIDEEQQPAGQ